MSSGRGLTALPVLQRQAPELLQQVLSGPGSLAASVPCLRSAAAAALAVSRPGLSSSKVPSSPLSLTRLTVSSSRATPPVAGSGKRLLPLRTKFSRACPPASTLQPSPCWSPSKALSPAGSLRPPRRSPNLPPLHTCSGRSCSVASVSHSLSLKTHADAIAVWTLFATIVQRVQRPGCCGAVGAALTKPLFGSAVKLGHG